MLALLVLLDVEHDKHELSEENHRGKVSQLTAERLLMPLQRLGALYTRAAVTSKGGRRCSSVHGNAWRERSRVLKFLAPLNFVALG